MNSMETAAFATMGPEWNLPDQDVWGTWSGMSSMNQPPWQDPWASGEQADPWQAPRRFGVMSLAYSSRPKAAVTENRYMPFKETVDGWSGEEDSDTDKDQVVMSEKIHGLGNTEEVGMNVSTNETH